ncbi:MAG TPA: OadG family transporter subunit [Phaeodactylibacter sp.]|nr:OadG family transporter subunit [Phaeodactylibacter sp.]
MIDSLTVLAQLPDGAEASPGAGGVVAVGFLFVIVVLALLASVTSAMGAWFTKQAAKSAAKAAAAAQATAEASAKSSSESPASGSSAVGSSASADEGDEPALMAVIAAAVHSAIGDRPHRVVSIRSAGPGWAQEGRRQIFSSHRVR